jgi:acetyl esterase/lipase
MKSENVVYGMYSGLALLMDVYAPEGKTNGYGIVHISGSGWGAPLGLDARQLKEASHVEIEALPLVAAGYTVFSINHRATPRFVYPAAVEDAQRAVRFVRHHAGRFGIRADRIGALGGSSGGHLVSMLGVLDGEGEAEDESAVNRESARVQCVVARAAPTSFMDMPERTAAAAVFLGAQVNRGAGEGSVERRRAVEASPLSHVAPGAPPFFLIHGDADDTVPIAQSELLAAALEKVGTPVKVRRVAGGVHGPGIVRDPEIAAEIRAWFDEHLRGEPRR